MNPQIISTIEILKNNIRFDSRLVITCHQKPDADALGSTNALALFFESLGIKVQVISPSNWASYLNWLPYIDQVINYEKNKQQADEFLNQADFVFCLDFNALDRVHSMSTALKLVPKQKMILIDHHQNPQSSFFEYIISEPHIPATCQLIYYFIEHFDVSKLNTKMATCLYAGIMTDTGSFKFSSTLPETHVVVAELLKHNINHQQIHANLFDNYRQNRLEFLGFILQNRLEFLQNGKVALLLATAEDIQKFDIQTGDTEGIINLLFEVKTVEIAAMVTDRFEERRWSFRSRSHHDVNMFAKTYFNGGGHQNAAGGKSYDSLENTVQNFKTHINNYQFK